VEKNINGVYMKRNIFFGVLAVMLAFSMAFVGCGDSGGGGGGGQPSGLPDDPYTSSGKPGSTPDYSGIDYTVVANGDASNMSTELTFTFTSPVSGLTVGDVEFWSDSSGAAKKGTVFGVNGLVWTLPITAVSKGSMNVRINKAGITSQWKAVTIHISFEDTLMAILTALGGTKVGSVTNDTVTLKGQTTLSEPVTLPAGAQLVLEDDAELTIKGPDGKLVISGDPGSLSNALSSENGNGGEKIIIDGGTFVIPGQLGVPTMTGFGDGSELWIKSDGKWIINNVDASGNLVPINYIGPQGTGVHYDYELLPGAEILMKVDTSVPKVTLAGKAEVVGSNPTDRRVGIATEFIIKGTNSKLTVVNGAILEVYPNLGDLQVGDGNGGGELVINSGGTLNIFNEVTVAESGALNNSGIINVEPTNAAGSTGGVLTVDANGKLINLEVNGTINVKRAVDNGALIVKGVLTNYGKVIVPATVTGTSNNVAIQIDGTFTNGTSATSSKALLKLAGNASKLVNVKNDGNGTTTFSGILNNLVVSVNTSEALEKGILVGNDAIIEPLNPTANTGAKFQGKIPIKITSAAGSTAQGGSNWSNASVNTVTWD